MAKTVVIGAGVGGLTVGALLAKQGFEVTVLEAHVYPGGCAGTFYHKGYRFDAGATVAGGFHKDGPHRRVGDVLGIDWPVKRAEPAWIVHLPDREIVRWGLDAMWREERDEKLPGMRRFWRQQEFAADQLWQFAARTPPFPPGSLTDIRRLLEKSRPSMLPLLPLAFMTVGHWLAANGVTEQASRTFVDAQLLISAQTTAAHANALYGAVAMDLPRAGAYHVKGGIGQLSRSLQASLERQGGAVHFRQAVTSLIQRADRTFLLKTNKGMEFEADLVIANLTPRALARLLGDQAPSSLIEEVNRRREPWAAFTVYAGVDSDVVQGKADHYQVVNSYDRALGEGNSIFVSLSDKDDTERAPDGQRAMTISTHTRIADWHEFAARDPEAYHARREEYQENLLTSAERALPGLRRGVRFVMNGSPQTFERFTKRPDGMVGGFPQTGILSMRGPRTGLPGLWLVGDSIFPGQSTAGVTAGAMRVSEDILRSHNSTASHFIPERSAPRVGHLTNP